MTDKLHCPFCGAELIFDPIGTIYCKTPHCKGRQIIAPIEIWQALIDGKKAQDALKIATEKLTDIELIVVRNGVFSGFEKMRIKQDVKDAINEILSITK